MICLGYKSAEKQEIVQRYCLERSVNKVYLLTSDVLAINIPNADVVRWEEIIKYKFFYRLLREIDRDSLVVINECLRTQDRNCLTYNCIRHYLNQAGHQIVFQYLPLIDTIDDFMILFDFDTRSRWKRERFSEKLMVESEIRVRRVPMTFQSLPVSVAGKLQSQYQKEKERLFRNIGQKDPHTIPRNLYLLSGKEKARHADPRLWYVGRNRRLKLPNMQTFQEHSYPHAPYHVFEFCHDFIHFTDFLALSGQTEINVLVADLPVDHWYFGRYTAWAERLKHAYAAIQQDEKRA